MNMEGDLFWKRSDSGVPQWQAESWPKWPHDSFRSFAGFAGSRSDYGSFCAIPVVVSEI